MGHVPHEPIRSARESVEFQRPQHRRATSDRYLKASAAARVARGKWAEDLVSRWYEQHGYVIVARNWRCKRGELDVVALHDRMLVVCEVKARASNAFGTPAEAVTPAKQLKVRRATADFRASMHVSHDPFASLVNTVRTVRFDVACVLGTQLEMLEDIF
ncbi:MAG: YraN family protein [Actinobacteria bacterium]|nr:MAG: YraN family protein [Actinomycetota bacterium]